MSGVCGDNRFEIIAKVKEHLIKATNIERQPEELKYADNVLFRLWQLGYFDSVEKISKLEEQVADLQSDHVHNLELMKGLNEKIAELNKANEWHYIKDGKDLPLEAGLHIRVVLHNGNEYICETDYYEPSEDEIGFGHLLIQLYSNNEWIDDNDVYAWCELSMPPKKE